MSAILMALVVLSGIGLAVYISVAPTIPHWLRLLFNFLLGTVLIAAICFVIFVITGIVTHI